MVQARMKLAIQAYMLHKYSSTMSYINRLAVLESIPVLSLGFSRRNSFAGIL
jgi:hypothetical protein